MRYKLTPEKGTTINSIIERTIGRAVSIEPATNPFGPGSKDLLGDVFQSFYDAEFEPLEKKNVPSDRVINHALMSWLSKDESFMEAREKTKGKLANSMVSSRIMYEYLMTDEAIRKALEAQDEPPPPPPAGGGGSGDGEQGENDSKVQSALSRINNLKNNVIGSQIVALGAKKAEQESDKADQMMRSWGVDPGNVNVNNIEDVMKVLSRNNSAIERIAELAGRFESVAANALTKARESFIGQVVDTKRTQDFNLMYGTEMCYLLSPDVPPAIHAKYTLDYLQSGLLGVEVRAEGKEFGSLYAMIDGSGSMSGDLEVYAKAVGLGLAKALNRDVLNNREYVLNTFGSGAGDNFFSVNSTQDWQEHFKWASLQQGGGTDFNWAFRRAIADIRKMPEGTDLFFITDGQCDLSDKVIQDWQKFKSETGTRLLYVDVSGYENPKLRGLCDLYIRIDFSKGTIETLADGIAAKLAENMETARLKKIEKESDE